MKTYAIALRRSPERYNYISKHLKKLDLDYKVIDAVDGSKLTEEEKEAFCNMEIINRNPKWLTIGAIGCQMSHYNCYQEFLKTGDKAALIVEDDIILPPNIKQLLPEIEEKMDEDEVVMIYYTSHHLIGLSTVGKSDLSSGALYFPTFMSPSSTAAYVVGRKAAEGLVRCVKPMIAAADTWHIFYRMGAFKYYRVWYPSLARTKNFKSSIDYFGGSPLRGKISKFIDDFKVPIIYQYLSYKRKQRVDVMLDRFKLTDDISPVYKAAHPELFPEAKA